MKLLSLIGIILILPLSIISAEDPFGDIFSDTEQDAGISDSSPETSSDGIKIDFSGVISTEIFYFFDAAQVQDNEVIFRPEADLNIKASNSFMEGIVSLNLSPQKWITRPDTIRTDTLNELYLRSFFSIGYLEAGLMKVEWGSADGIHVLDPLSYWDLTDGFSFDVISLKKAGEMVKMNFHVKETGLLELVYKPFFSSHIMAQEGRWSIGTENIPNLHVPDTTTLEYSQAAMRFTSTINGFDLGAQYYYGYLPEPGITTDGTDFYLAYDRAHLFGLEGGTSLGIFTFWLEAGYWLTGDIQGDDPTVHNNRIVYLPGFDFTIPRTKLYFNIQLMGDYTLKTENLSIGDVDDPTGNGTPAHNNILLVAGDYSFNRDKTKIRLGGMWSIEENAYIIMPEFLWYFNDYLDFSISGQIIDGQGGKNGMLQSWKNNDNLKVKLSYTF